MQLPGNSRVTDEQQALTGSVVQFLTAAGARHHVTLAEGLEAWYRIRLEPTSGGRLEVTIDVAPDMFVVAANGASLRLARVDFPDGSVWLETCTETITRLVGHDLVLRTRRTLFGKIVGAVLIPSDAGNDVWNGELLACRGMGKLYRYPKWLEP